MVGVLLFVVLLFFGAFVAQDRLAVRPISTMRVRYTGRIAPCASKGCAISAAMTIDKTYFISGG
jgi:hypothetical protein